MSLAIFRYSELSSNFGDWINSNCSNCGNNYDNIPDCFKSGWSKRQDSEITTKYNGKTLDSVYIWKPYFTITIKSEQSVAIEKISKEHIVEKLCEELGNFNDINKQVTENGLLTYLNIIGKFIIEHFSFVTSILNRNMLVIYTDAKHATIDDITQTCIPTSETITTEGGTRRTVHHEPLSAYMENIFYNIKDNIRTYQTKYDIKVVNANGHTETITIPTQLT